MANRTVTTIHGRQDLPDLKPLYIGFSDMPPGVDFQRAAKAGRQRQLRRHRAARASRSSAQAHLRSRRRLSGVSGPHLAGEAADRAIELARAVGIPIRIAAKVDKVDEAYFRATIAPLLDQPGVEFIGEIDERAKSEFLGEARALLFPIDWPEPFGLFMIEAMACGTPVLAFRCGSVPEIVDPGVTGLIVDTMEEAVRRCRRSWRSIATQCAGVSRNGFPPPAWPRTTCRSTIRCSAASRSRTAIQRCRRCSRFEKEMN